MTTSHSSLFKVAIFIALAFNFAHAQALIIADCDNMPDAYVTAETFYYNANAYQLHTIDLYSTHVVGNIASACGGIGAFLETDSTAEVDMEDKAAYFRAKRNNNKRKSTLAPSPDHSSKKSALSRLRKKQSGASFLEMTARTTTLTEAEVVYLLRWTAALIQQQGTNLSSYFLAGNYNVCATALRLFFSNQYFPLEPGYSNPTQDDWGDKDTWRYAQIDWLVDIAYESLQCTW